MQKNNSTNIYLYPGKCGVRSSRFSNYCLKGANCICLDEFYESDQHFFINQGRMQDDFWRDTIWSNFRIYSTYSDRQAWANSVDPDQTPQNACKTFTETVMYLTKDL